MGTSPVLSVRLDPKLRKKLQRFAAADRRSMSAVVVLAVEEFLAHQPVSIAERRKAYPEKRNVPK